MKQFKSSHFRYKGIPPNEWKVEKTRTHQILYEGNDCEKAVSTFENEKSAATLWYAQTIWLNFEKPPMAKGWNWRWKLFRTKK